MTQREALNILKLGHNAYITGPAGSGKTFLLNKYISYLNENGVGIAITASTGIAATHIGGTTIHSWSGIGIKKDLSKQDLKSLLRRQYLRKRFRTTRVLIIDEVSMLHPWQFDLVNKICQDFKKNAAPFGGLQVICSGDLFQLPPIRKDEGSNTQFVTSSTVWKEMNMRVCYLKEQHRQTDKKLYSLLNNIRRGKSKLEAKQILKTLQSKKNKLSITPTKLYTHNADVDNINNKELDKLPSKKLVYCMSSRGKENVTEILKSGCLAPERLFLKKDALVMFVKNNFERGYVNGTMGTIKDFNKNKLPIVETLDGKQITVTPAKWTIDEEGEVIAELNQLPLRLAWAITVHKSQGMSLDAAEIDLSNAFVPGMGYVALSRLKNLKNLHLLGFNDTSLEVDQNVKEIDKDLRQKSKETKKYLKSLGLIRTLALQNKFIDSFN